MHITAHDIARIRNIIECARLELKIWTFLSPAQRQSLKKKIAKFQTHIDDFENKIKAE